MLHTVSAIVLRTIRHGDPTTILKCYTDRFGLRSYVVRTGSKKGTRMALLLPLNRLEMVVTEDADRDLNNVREMRVDVRRDVLILRRQMQFPGHMRQHQDAHHRGQDA